MSLRRVVPRNYDPKGERFLIASRFPTPPLASIVETFRIENPFLEVQFQKDPPKDPPEVLVADDRTMAELLRAPTEGYEDAIIIPEIAANNFELKHGLINLVQNKQFFRHDKEDPHAHIRYFNKITSTMRVPNIPSSTIKLMLFPFSLEGAARIWLEKEAPRSIRTWEYLVSKFINQFFPLSKTTNLRNEITRFQQRFDESFYEAWERFNDLLRACPHHGFSKLHQLDTFYNALNVNDQDSLNSAAGSGTLPGNTVTNPKEDLKGITTRSGVAYQGPTIPTQSKVVKKGTEVTKDQVQTPSSQSTAPVQPPVAQPKTQTPVSEPVVALVSVPMPNLNPSIPYPSRRDTKRRRDQANEQIEKFYKIFKDMSFEISFTDALILMLKFDSTIKSLIGNKEKLSEMARTPMNEHCSAVILNKLPRKLKDPGKFLIPCEFPGMDECLALADLGANINLMPLSVWEELSLLELTPTCMTLELADRLVSKPIGIAKDVSVKTGQALIDVHKGELTLRIRNKAITYNLDKTSRYSANYNQMTANKIDVICEMYSQEVLGFSNTTASGNPTPYDDPIVFTTSPTLTPFGDSDFLLFEEADAFLGLEDDPNSPEFNPFYYDPEGDILLLEAILNSEPLPPLPNHEQYLPSYKKELKVCEAETVKSSVDEPPKVELKDLPPHLKYVLKSHKRAIAWKLSDIQGINSKLCTHKILMEEDYKPAVQHQRRVNPKIHDVIKKEVEKLLDAGMIYPISDSPWVSPVCIDYRKLNEATRKDYFPLSFMDQMLEILAGNEYYCFFDGFSGYIQIPIDPSDQEKTTFTCPYGTFAYRRMPFGLCNAPGMFQRCMLAIFHDMVEKTMEVFMDDFSVFGNSFENCLSRLDKMLQSDFAIGAVLGQRHEIHFKPIHYASKTMNDAESNYTTTEKEMLAVVFAFEKFRSYLIMNKSIVHTDHSSLKYLFAKKDAKARLLRWVLLLQEFDFKVLDTKGAKNLAADYLSRLENPYENSRNNFPQKEASPAIAEPLRIENPFLEDQFQEDPPKDPPEVPMANDRTMA
nr:reverse transcriptase domain-containing protein [Tanacetum cinerariifolium]